MLSEQYTYFCKIDRIDLFVVYCRYNNVSLGDVQFKVGTYGGKEVTSYFQAD